jgi:histidyl-tRNA synthetase
MANNGALPGFRDFYPAECAEREHVFRAWRTVASRYAFVEYDGPPLEPLDLYTRKSGEEIVGQLYEFTDKGDRRVALRPEMTPSFARMVSARANALRKPLRWFSIPQLFRYERAQKGRLREHFQLNVDIVGEPSEAADAELIAVAVDIMRELGLTSADVRVRMSDRRLLWAGLDALGFDASQRDLSLAVIDKIARQPRDVSAAKLRDGGITPDRVEKLLELVATKSVGDFVAKTGEHTGVAAAAEPMVRAIEYLSALGVGDWIDFDPTIVRGLAYYTGIVFELFDARGEFRAICGGGRYDDLLNSLGGVDLPALGFGMGDVVLSELLRARNLMPPNAGESGADFYIVGGGASARRPFTDALRLARALRDGGFAVDHAMSAERYASQAARNQLEAAKKSGARAAIYFDEADAVTAMSLGGRLSGAPRYTMHADLALGGRELAPLRAWLEAL